LLVPRKKWVPIVITLTLLAVFGFAVHMGGLLGDSDAEKNTTGDVSS
jgi:hypothetical protein